MRLRGAIHRSLAVPEPVDAASRQRPLPRREERRKGRGHAAARKRAFREWEADEVGDPAQGLLLYQVGPAGRDGQVRVVGRHERRGQHPYLQAGRADVAEVERPGGRDAGVQDLAASARATSTSQDSSGAARRGVRSGSRPIAARRFAARRKTPSLADYAFEFVQNTLAVGESGRPARSCSASVPCPCRLTALPYSSTPAPPPIRS